MDVQCLECGEWYCYEPYEDWLEDYADEDEMKANHSFICGECE